MEAANNKIFWFKVVGDSMDDGTSKGIYNEDTIECHRIEKDAIDTGGCYVIKLNSGQCLIKKISDFNVKDNIITLHSLNLKYGDLTVNIDDVAELYRAKTIISRRIR